MTDKPEQQGLLQAEGAMPAKKDGAALGLTVINQPSVPRKSKKSQATRPVMTTPLQLNIALDEEQIPLLAHAGNAVSINPEICNTSHLKR